MAVWFLPRSLSDEMRGRALLRGEVIWPADFGLDLSRAHTLAHLREQLGIQQPEEPPERLQEKAETLWRLLHEIDIDDYIVMPSQAGDGVMLGEIIGERRFAQTEEGAFHSWPVTWIRPHIPLANLPGMEPYLRLNLLSVIDETPLAALCRHIPALNHAAGYAMFKWISFILLLFELIYFWPH
jgi:hypothetical protein